MKAINFTNREAGTVKVIHYSTASVVSIRVSDSEQAENGDRRETYQTLWLDYGDFYNLKKIFDELSI